MIARHHREGVGWERSEKVNLAAGLPSTKDQVKETGMPNPGRPVQVIDQAQLEYRTEPMGCL